MKKYTRERRNGGSREETGEATVLVCPLAGAARWTKALFHLERGDPHTWWLHPQIFPCLKENLLKPQPCLSEGKGQKEAAGGFVWKLLAHTLYGNINFQGFTEEQKSGKSHR